MKCLTRVRYVRVSVALVVVLGIGMHGGEALAGTLNPPPSAVDANGNPVPTPSTPPSWGQVLPANARFTLVVGGQAVLDNETGLVWERTLDITGGQNLNGLRIWTDAIAFCAQREVGGRKGWTLPMREQLASLVDTSNNNPALPTGHPFLNVQQGGETARGYWSATTDAVFPQIGWAVHFGHSSFNNVVASEFKSIREAVWCVRGAQTFDGNTHNSLH